MISRHAISGFFFIAAMYLVKTNQLILSLVMVGGAFLVLKVKLKSKQNKENMNA